MNELEWSKLNHWIAEQLSNIGLSIKKVQCCAVRSSRSEDAPLFHLQLGLSLKVAAY